MAKSDNLRNAREAKQDEFYTKLEDIEFELKHYREHFKNKIVFCNCDDPYESNFFKYFAMNFNFLGLKKLIATCYDGSPVAGTQLSLDLFDETTGELNKNKTAYKVEITEIKDFNGDGVVDLADVELMIKQEGIVKKLDGNGDFRSEECIELLNEADIVCTNPPFSLFREYISTLTKFEKKFLIIGNKNAVEYSEVFVPMKNNELWMGYGRPSQFYTPNGITNKVQGLCRWFTNLDIAKRHEEIVLWKKYSITEFPQYDHINAIEVGKVSEIPCDYDGIMGVPLTFIDSYNPKQFEIIDCTNGRYGIVDSLKVNDYLRKNRFRICSINNVSKYARLLIRRVK